MCIADDSNQKHFCEEGERVLVSGHFFSAKFSTYGEFLREKMSL